MRRIAIIGLALVGLGAMASVRVASAAEEASAPADGPVTIEDIRGMRKERATMKQIMERIEKRGLGFTIDDETQRKLRTMGFTLKMVGQLKGMQAAPAAPEAHGAAPPPMADAGAHAVPDAPAGKPAGVRRVLNPGTENQYAATAERVKKIVATSNTSVKAHPTKHIMLLANPRIAAKALPDLNQVQKLIAERFPEPIASGVDPRASNIALLESRYEYTSWMKALYKVHEDAGLTFNSPDALANMLATDSVFVHGIFSVCLEGMNEEGIRRRLAFSVGFQYMEQLTDNKGPAGLRTGFGDMTETMMFRYPTVTVSSGYNNRNVAAPPAHWVDLVRQRVATNKLAGIADAMNYSTSTMTMDQYAESWSLTEFLSSEPRNFAELVVALEQGNNAAAAIEKIYGLNDAALQKRWKLFVQGKR